MAKKIRLGYDILSKGAIETESGVNIDDALRQNQQQIAITKEELNQKITDILSSSDLIYLDGTRGDDSNDGLTKKTAVKTLHGAVTAFNNAKTDNPYFSVLKVYVVNRISYAYALPSNEEIHSTGYDSIELYGDTVEIANTEDTTTTLKSYSIKVVAKTATVHLANVEYDVSSSTVSVEGISVTGEYLTTGNITIKASDLVRINIAGVQDSTSEYKPSINITSGDTVYMTGAEANDLIILANKDVILNNVNCHDLYIETKTSSVDIRGGINVYGNTKISCVTFIPSAGSHTYHGNMIVEASDYINMINAGTMYIAGYAIFNAATHYNGSSSMYVTKLSISAGSYDGILNNVVTNSYGIFPYMSSDKIYDETTQSIYHFDIGEQDFYTLYSNIQNKYADVSIISKGKVYISNNGTLNVKSLNLKCRNLSIYTPVSVGFFNIDVEEQIEMQNPGSSIYMLLNAGDSTTSDYISYDNNSNNTLKCGSLYCSTYYNDINNYGLIRPAYGNSVKNIDIQIGMILSPSYNGSGALSPTVLGPCESGSHTFNSTISGHIGPYAGNYGPTMKVSPWNHDIRSIPTSYSNTIIDPIPGSSSNTNGVIALKYDDVIETNHFWFDPDQGDDTLDGCTRQTAVKTVTALVHAMMKKTGGSYSNGVFNLYQPITIHILSVSNGSCRDCRWFNNANDVYTLPDWMYNEGNLKGICFDYVASYGGSRVQFNMLEFVPEAPDMSLYVRAFNANVLIAKGFYNIGLVGYGSSGINYLEASGSVGIYNSSYYGGYSYYSSRLGPLSIKARDIVLYGWFMNLTAKAENQLIIYDTYGGSSDSDGNCCLAGITTLEAETIQLGTSINSGGYNNLYKIGISGIAYIKATAYINCYVDSMYNAVVFMESGDSISGGFADGFFKGQFHAKCTNCYLGYSSGTNSYYSFNTYTAASNYGGAGIIDIQASKSINISGWGTNSGGDNYLYAVDLYLKAPIISGTSNLYVYGNNGTGKILVDADEMYFGLKPYYYGYIFIKSQHCATPQVLNSGGPWTDTGGPTYINLDIGKLRNSIQLPTYVDTSSGKTRTYEITGRIGLMNNPVLYWGQTVDPDNPPSISNAVYNFSIVVGHCTVSGHGIDKTGWIPENSGTVIVLNDQKLLTAGQGINIADTGDAIVISADPKSTIVQCPVTIENGIATVSLTLNRYNVITGIDDTVTDLVIDLPVESTATLLTEIGFEFYLDGFAQTLNSVTFTNSTEQFSSIVPNEFTPEHLYQGTLVNRCVTLVEYDRPDTSVLEINGKKYRTVKIGEQTWMAENLADASSGVWYDNDQATYESLGYGKLYTHDEAVAIASLVPGWHLPTESDYEILANLIGSNNSTKLKSDTKWNGNNESGFNATPAGKGSGISPNITFSYVGPSSGVTELLCTQVDNNNNAPYVKQLSGSPYIWSSGGTISRDQNYGSVRLVKDMSVNIGGRDYKVVQIGNQLWMAENLDWKFNGLTFRDGTSGNEITSDATIAQGAYYNYDESTYGASGNKYGMLYNWTAADYINKQLTELKVPDGWHVATSDDYNSLFNTCGENPGTKLKSTTDWPSGGEGTDYYGFNVKPSGEWSDGWYMIGTSLWQSSEHAPGASVAYNYHLNANSSDVSEGYGDKYRLMSLRLVKNLT